MILSGELLTAAQYAVRDVVVRRTLGGQPIPSMVRALERALTASADGSDECDAAPHLAPDDLIDTVTAAQILGCSTRRIRQITTDLDGRQIGGRWVFPRRSVETYARAKGVGNAGD